MERRPVRHVPLVGDVAAGTDVLAEENVEELYPLPADFTGEGDLFMLRVRGESMIGAGILDGDFVVAEQGRRRRTRTTSSSPASRAARRPSSAIAAMDPRDRSSPENPITIEPMVFDADDVQLYGKVVAVLRRL